MAEPINALIPPNPLGAEAPQNALARGWAMLTDPFTLQKALIRQSTDLYGWKDRVGGKADAFRHLMGTALLAQRHGEPYAKFITDLHENRWLPWIGGATQSEKDREMDLYNNQIGLNLAKQAQSYEDLWSLAKQYVDTGKTKTYK